MCKLISSKLFTHPSVENLVEIANCIEVLAIPRRKEEQLKLIFNWAYNTLRLKVISSAKNEADDLENDKIFYSHYFQHITDKASISLLQFYRPHANNKLKKSSPKSFNSKFLKLIKQSTKFMDDFTDLLEQELLVCQEKIIEKRVVRFFKRWESQAETTGDLNATFLALLNSMKHCKKFKFPWSLREILKAREVVSKTFRELKLD